MISQTAVCVDVGDEYTDVICHGGGITDGLFHCITEDSVQNVVSAELIAYSVPPLKRTVASHNNSLDFDVGPYVESAVVEDTGNGYDIWNPPSLNLTSYRSARQNVIEYLAPMGHEAYYPPWDNRSVTGIKIRGKTGYVSPSASSQSYSDAGATTDDVDFVDNLAILLNVTNSGSISSSEIVRRSNRLNMKDATINVDRPQHYPYCIHIAKSVNGDMTENSARVWNDSIKIYRAMYRYQKWCENNTGDIDVLANQIAMEINHALGWDVRSIATLTPYLNDGMFPYDDDYRWKVPDEPGRYGTWSDVNPRYQCRYYEKCFFIVDTQNEPFNMGTNVQAAPLAVAPRERGGLKSSYLNSMLTDGGLYPCVTSIWGILGLAAKLGTPVATNNVKYTHYDGTIQTLWGYTSSVDVRTTLHGMYNTYLFGSAANIRLGVRSCTALVRSGSYTIEELTKEVQDQMNIAYYTIENHYTLRDPVQDNDSFPIPEFFTVTLESSSTYNGEEAPVPSNVRSNQLLDLRVRISLNTRTIVLGAGNTNSPQPVWKKRDLWNDKYELTLRNLTGPNKNRSICKTLGFRSLDISDVEYVTYVSTIYNPNAHYSYGIQAMSVYNLLNGHSHTSRISVAFNGETSFLHLGFAMADDDRVNRAIDWRPKKMNLDTKRTINQVTVRLYDTKTNTEWRSNASDALMVFIRLYKI